MKTLIINGLVVLESGEVQADLLIDQGKIAGILARGTTLPQADEIIDAAGLVILPGAIDVHTHFTGSHDFPEQELREGTRGAAAHGVTTIVEMPHSLPPATSNQKLHFQARDAGPQLLGGFRHVGRAGRQQRQPAGGAGRAGCGGL